MNTESRAKMLSHQTAFTAQQVAYIGRDKCRELAGDTAANALAREIIRTCAIVKDIPDEGACFRTVALVYDREDAAAAEQQLEDARLKGMRDAAQILRELAALYDALPNYGRVQALAMRGVADDIERRATARNPEATP